MARLEVNIDYKECNKAKRGFSQKKSQPSLKTRNLIKDGECYNQSERE